MLGGHADASSVPVPSLAATVKSGQVRVLGVLKSEPSRFRLMRRPSSPSGTRGRIRLTGDRRPGRDAQGDHHRAGDRAEDLQMEDPELVKKMNDVWQESYVLSPEESVKIWEKVQANAKALMAEIQR